MKKFNSVSPYLLLLTPMILIIGLLKLNMHNEIPADKYQASINLQVPSFKVMISNIF